MAVADHAFAGSLTVFLAERDNTLLMALVFG